MIIRCNSCEKSFSVPDSAITNNGRLVQCSACGNKWTQYPVSKKIENKTITLVKKVKKIEAKKSIPKKKIKKKKKQIETYSEEYLQNKHGIKIIDPSSANNSNKKQKINSQKKKDIGFGFYNYLITFIVLIIAFFGTLNLTREIISLNFPYLSVYIDYLYETLSNIKLIIFDIVYN
tara:strand:- start:52 stop:579 length:528 start_codon:yes stop_codon:yes gene_type:complete